LSSSSTATRCSPTSTETISSRFAWGSGARRGASRRRLLPPCWRRRSCRWETALRSGFRSCPFFSGFAAALGFAAGRLSSDSDVSAARGLLRPLPPRLPRRRLGFVGSVAAAPSPARGAAASAVAGCCRFGGLVAAAFAQALAP